MPVRNQDVYESSDQNNGPLGFLNIMGQSKAFTSGWSGFAVKTIVVSNTAATVFGLSSWMLFSGVAGPALSFLAGTGFGFVGGLVHRWRTDSHSALHLFQLYPELFEFHSKLLEPRQFAGVEFKEWAKDVHTCRAKQGLLIAAMYSAGPALDRINQEQEAAVLQKFLPQEVQE